MLRSVVAPVDELGHSVAITFEDGLDRTVGPVADPSRHAGFPGPSRTGHPEAHFLHAPVDFDVPTYDSGPHQARGPNHLRSA